MDGEMEMICVLIHPRQIYVYVYQTMLKKIVEKCWLLSIMLSENVEIPRWDNNASTYTATSMQK